MFETPVSSSKVANVMPFAVPGRCRNKTNPCGSHPVSMFDVDQLPCGDATTRVELLA